MLTNSIFHQVFSPLTILAAQTVASQTVLYGGVILKATQSAMLVVSLFSSKKSFFALLSGHFWGVLGWTRVSQTRQGNLLISFPFSLYSTFKEGCSIFAWFLCACSSPGFFPNYGYTLLCNALSMPIRLKNHFTGFNLKHGGSTCFTHIHESLSRSPSSNPFFRLVCAS